VNPRLLTVAVHAGRLGLCDSVGVHQIALHTGPACLQITVLTLDIEARGLVVGFATDGTRHLSKCDRDPFIPRPPFCIQFLHHINKNERPRILGHN
jgi:hypothetical protein